MENKEKMDIEKEFQHYLEIFKHDKELGKALSLVSFPAWFNDKFLQENSMMKKAAAFLKTIKETVPCI